MHEDCRESRIALSSRLKKFRNRTGWSQAKTAIWLELGRTHYADLEYACRKCLPGDFDKIISKINEFETQIGIKVS